MLIKIEIEGQEGKLVEALGGALADLVLAVLPPNARIVGDVTGTREAVDADVVQGSVHRRTLNDLQAAGRKLQSLQRKMDEIVGALDLPGAPAVALDGSGKVRGRYARARWAADTINNACKLIDRSNDLIKSLEYERVQVRAALGLDADANLDDVIGQIGLAVAALLEEQEVGLPETHGALSQHAIVEEELNQAE